MKTPTSPDIEGPFYKPGAPERNDLFLIDSGVKALCIFGKVVDVEEKPLLAQVELWHANEKGNYDHEGYRYRGLIKTDDDGEFDFFSIVPGRYLNGKQFRPAHLHFRIVCDGYQELITQLYFKDDPYNAVDPWFDSKREVEIIKSGYARTVEYEFVLTRARGHRDED